MNSTINQAKIEFSFPWLYQIPAHRRKHGVEVLSSEFGYYRFNISQAGRAGIMKFPPKDQVWFVIHYQLCYGSFLLQERNHRPADAVYRTY